MKTQYYDDRNILCGTIEPSGSAEFYNNAGNIEKGPAAYEAIALDGERFYPLCENTAKHWLWIKGRLAFHAAQ